MSETLSSGSVCTKLERIAEMARRHPERVFTSVSHAIDMDFLHEAYRRTRKDGATGIDGQTAKDYDRELESNLEWLLSRLKRGEYRAPAVRQVEIPKASGGTRALGIPTFEDKVLQRAVTMVLEAIYEQDFLPCSYGFRPGRSAHMALEALWKGVMSMGGAWVLEVDVEKFFDALDHGHLRGFLDQRVTDGVLRRVVHKWLKAGVMREGEHLRPERGTPQGGVISPLLANIFLHEVVDRWFANDVQPRLKGRALLVRYADDLVMVFEREDDARRLQKVLPKRLGRYGLRAHPDKTRLVRFEPPREDGERGARDEPRSFELLGFTHYWGKSRKGAWVVKHKASSKGLSRTLHGIWQSCRRNGHRSLKEQHRVLSAKVRGHYGYFGITGNGRMLEQFWLQARRAWQRWLARRSQRGITWRSYQAIFDRYPLPRPRVVHSVLRSANA